MTGRKPNSVRIIGGQWRSRLLAFPDVPGLRPTPDRVRETLFNWLQNDIHGARCLDLYAGSGALGFEALSRGASAAVLVEQNHQAVQQLQSTARLLNTEQAIIVSAAALQYVQHCRDSFDIVFIDPPFPLGEWQAMVNALEVSACLTSNAIIYMESPVVGAPWTVPAHWQLTKSGTAGDVRHQLYRRQSKPETT